MEAATKYTLSELAAVSFWPDVPSQPENKAGVCRLSVPEPGYIGGETCLFVDVRRSLIKELIAKKQDIDDRLKMSRMPLIMFMITSLVPNGLPGFLVNLIKKSGRVATYATSNFKTLPVTMEFMGMPVDRVFVVPPFTPEVLGITPLLLNIFCIK